MTLAFTAEQQDAICAQDRNLLIAAGAGSGKTTVLVERIIRWVEAGGSISRPARFDLYQCGCFRYAQPYWQRYGSTFANTTL